MGEAGRPRGLTVHHYPEQALWRSVGYVLGDGARDALAARVGVDPGFLAQVEEMGLLPREPDGSLGAAAARRAHLLGFATSRGIDAEHLLRALADYGDLFAAFDRLAPAPAAVDRDAVVAEVGLDVELAEQIAEASGTPAGAPVTVEDLDALRSAKQALELGLPVPVLLQLLRVFADNMQRLAEAENRIFHDHVHERFRAEGLAGRELMEATASISSGLLELVEPTVLYFHRRAWAAAAQHDFIRHLTEESRPVQRAPGAEHCTVMFADLSGFTPLTAAMGDEAAAELLSRFGKAVRRTTAAHDGRVIKQIGDAFMIVFEDRRAAVLCGAALLAWCASEPRFPPLHVGAHAGETLFHDGDYVGAAVNLAARVAGVTEPSQFLVTEQVVEGLDLSAEVVLSPLGVRTLKGVAQPVQLTAVSRSGPGPDRLRDPVCGMSVDAGSFARSWAGRSWSFCSVRCAETFDQNRDRYAAPSSGQH